MENPENPYFSLRENENLIDIYEERNSDTITQNDQKIKVIF